MSGAATPTESPASPAEVQSFTMPDTSDMMFSLEGLQSDEQRRVLDMVSARGIERKHIFNQS